MPQEPYHPLRRQFRSEALADFCAVYYSTLVSFGHWDDLRSIEFSRIQQHWKNQNYHAAARLFWSRQKIERALHLAGLDDLVHLGMFARSGRELVSVVEGPIDGHVVDYWRRKWTDKVELMIAAPSQCSQFHIACDVTMIKKALGIDDDDDLDEALYSNYHRFQVRVTHFKKVRYISRASVRLTNVSVGVGEPFSLTSLSFMQHSPTFCAEVCSSLCVVDGELEFTPFLLYEAVDDKSISELSFFSVESVRIEHLVDRDTTLDVRQKRIICTDLDGKSHSYIGLFKNLHRFSQGDFVRLLVKRRWGSGEAFILATEQIDENRLLQDGVCSESNDRDFRGAVGLLPVQAFLEEIPADGDLVPIGSLSIGQEIEHGVHGRGIIVERSQWRGNEEVKVKFYGDLRRHPTAVHVLTPDVPVASFWSNLKLISINPDE